MKKIDDPLLENLSPIAIKEIVEKVKYQTAEPKDAMRLMLLFCDLVKSNKQIPKELLHHFKYAFEAVASTGMSADRALGIKRSNNRPPASEYGGTMIAHKVLQERLKGNTYEIAVNSVSGEYGVGTTKVKNAWKKYKEQALNTELMYRHLAHNVFSQKDKKLIDEIYEGESFYSSPFYPNTRAD